MSSYTGSGRLLAVDESARLEVDRILGSEVFRSSDSLKRLLVFLADKSLAGEGAELKEYSIGIDALGKPATFDPRQDAAVRITARRLRQKLSEYYRTEGKDDPVVVELPKGHYQLNWQVRQLPLEQQPFAPVNVENLRRRGAFAWIAWALAGTAVLWAAWATVQLREERARQVAGLASWTPELATIWKPFVAPERALLISISSPLFFDISGLGIFRDEQVNRPEDAANSPALAAIRKTLRPQSVEPFFSYGTLGGANAGFVLGKTLGPRKRDISLVYGHELSWRQVSQNNVILIGSPRFFNTQLVNMPVTTELNLEPGVGIRNLHPQGEEPAMFVDRDTHQSGIAYTLVSHTPGPLGNTDVMSFAGRSGSGIAGGVVWFTEPASAKTLLSILRKANGEIPRYYQVLLKVRFQDGVPVEASYVLHRELHPAAR
jgi:hypothetical protein